MGFQTNRYKKADVKKAGIHPIWRGIGCIMLILIPVISYLGSLVFLQYGPKYGLTGWITRDILVEGSDPYLYVKIGITIVISLVFFLIFMMITFIMNKLFGAPAYGPLDAPPEKFKGKEYKR